MEHGLATRPELREDVARRVRDSASAGSDRELYAGGSEKAGWRQLDALVGPSHCARERTVNDPLH